jgi:hypothetical protein
MDQVAVMWYSKVKSYAQQLSWNEKCLKLSSTRKAFSGCTEDSQFQHPNGFVPEFRIGAKNIILSQKHQFD